MKSVTMYQCEICNKLYHNEKDAIYCEGRGIEPIYDIVGKEFEYQVGIIKDFDLPVYETRKIINAKNEGHYAIYTTLKYSLDSEEWEDESTITNNDLLSNSDLI